MAEKKVEHTPTPWDDITLLGVREMRRGGYIWHHWLSTQKSELGQANTAFALRAVNSHDALVEACQRALRFITNGIEFGYITMPDMYTPDPAHEVPDLLRAAISKASGAHQGEI